MKTEEIWKGEVLDEHVIFSSGVTESYLCVDCGVNTAPGCTPGDEVMANLYRPRRRTKVVGRLVAGPKTELYRVHDRVWKKAGMEEWGGCLCIGCLETRLGRKLKPKDFNDHVFNVLPCSPRLRSRRK